MGDGDDDSSSGDGSEDVYNGSMEPVLVSLSNSYSDDNSILISDIRPSSCPAYTVTDYFVY